VVSRELTKKFEEVKRGSISGILSQFSSKEIRGEFTLVVAGKDKGTDKDSLTQEIRDTIKEWLREKDMSVREIALQLSEKEGLPYRRLYRECLSVKKDLGCS
jgi:16S rRNA (cytidine1402-2'-O)-methyltransferase